MIAGFWYNFFRCWKVHVCECVPMSGHLFHSVIEVSVRPSCIQHVVFCLYRRNVYLAVYRVCRSPRGFTAVGYCLEYYQKTLFTGQRTMELLCNAAYMYRSEIRVGITCTLRKKSLLWFARARVYEKFVEADDGRPVCACRFRASGRYRL